MEQIEVSTVFFLNKIEVVIQQTNRVFGTQACLRLKDIAGARFAIGQILLEAEESNGKFKNNNNMFHESL